MPYKDPNAWKEWRLRNHERQLAKERVYQAAYREKNRDKDRAKHKRYYERHKERVLARKADWKKSPEGRAWFENYRATHNANVKRYQETAQGRLSRIVATANRRTRQSDAGGVATLEQIKARVEFYGGRCYLCGSDYEHIDHVIPVAKGGTNWPANLRPICASCNFRKHDKSLEEVRRDHLTVVPA